MTLGQLVGLILLFNAMTFGNGPVMIPLLRDSLVGGRGVLTTEELLYAFTVARITPGPANSYVASIGYMLFGLPGATLCALAVIAPGYLMLPLEYGYGLVRSARAVSGFTRGLIGASVGLIFAASVEMARGSLTSPLSWFVFVIAVVAGSVLRWNNLLVLLVPSLVGLALAALL
jgi:chromate transporter